MLKRMRTMLVLVVIFIAVIALWKFFQIRAAIAMGAKFAMPPASVTTAKATAQKWQPILSAVGSLKAINGVVVSTDLAGIVSEIAVESGGEVKKGSLIVKLETRQEEAQLHSAEARRDLSQLSLGRQKDLLARKTASQAEYDSAAAEFRQADAAVQEANALIARKTIVAPFEGVLGIRQVDLGQYLNVGAPIAPLQSMDPIYVDFALPQQQLAQITAGQALRIKGAGTGDEKYAGEISAIDSRVDETTRNVTVRGTVRNADGHLRAGMFVSVEVLLPEKEGVISVPATSISYAPYGDSVFVVKSSPGSDGKPALTVLQQFVKLGETRGDQVAILSGVKTDDEVVTSGVFKLRSGGAVQINNSVRPANEANPTPPDT